MYTIIGGDGKEYGPVTVDKVREWMATNRANAHTRIKRIDGGVWTTVGQLPEFGAAGAATEPQPGSAASAPATPLTGSPAEIAAALSAQSRTIDVFGCLGRSFELWKANLLPLVGVTFVVLLAASALGAIPLVGILANLVLTGVFYGGLYYYYLGKMRGEPREFADAFAGFSKAFGPLALTNLLQIGLTCAVMLVLLAPWLVPIFLAAKNGAEPNPLIFVGIFIFALPMVYLGVSWSYAFALVIDKGLGPWTALEVSRRLVTKQWFRVFFVLILGAFVAMLGLIGLFIGVIFTLPLFFGAVLHAYEDLTGGKG